ncbi:hypothetical protein [Streptomyces sp. SDr-06]|uniref:hypothetical protein n=1 Tax=Streptomyces sp. SDr-06 TaxID=2267702 RepID=UPI0011C0432F|nr:hypothetical protein [Streptomyces sp. SDr-06]
MRDTQHMPTASSDSPGPHHPAVTVPAAARLVELIVKAVRNGDEQTIRTLLHELTEVADIEALLLLRRRLNEDMYWRAHPALRANPGAA